jgi:hypothetical protein
MNCEIHHFSLGVTIDAIQEHYCTGMKNARSFYDHGENSFLCMKTPFLNWANNFEG